MNPTARLHQVGQSLWLDNITRTILGDGTLAGYIDELSVTGLTSNRRSSTRRSPAATPTTPRSPRSQTPPRRAGGSAKLRRARLLRARDRRLARRTDLFAGVHERTAGVDGWASLEVSPLIADDTEATIQQAAALHAKAERRNLFIKIPGTEAGKKAIEESIFAGVPINVTLLFDDVQYLAAADAYMRGIERRIEAGLSPDVTSVASLFISRWDVAVAETVPEELHNRLGIAVGGRAYAAYRQLLDSDRWLGLENEGARPQRFLWASTGPRTPAPPTPSTSRPSPRR